MSPPRGGRAEAGGEGVAQLLEVAAVLAESAAFDYLDAPIRRLAGLDIPVPYNRDLERRMVPQIEDIVATARRLVKEAK